MRRSRDYGFQPEPSSIRFAVKPHCGAVRRNESMVPRTIAASWGIPDSTRAAFAQPCRAPAGSLAAHYRARSNRPLLQLRRAPTHEPSLAELRPTGRNGAKPSPVSPCTELAARHNNIASLGRGQRRLNLNKAGTLSFVIHVLQPEQNPSNRDDEVYHHKDNHHRVIQNHGEIGKPVAPERPTSKA